MREKELESALDRSLIILEDLIDDLEDKGLWIYYSRLNKKVVQIDEIREIIKQYKTLLEE